MERYIKAVPYSETVHIVLLGWDQMAANNFLADNS